MNINFTNKLKPAALHAAGFSLLELMIVLAILGVLASTGAPSIYGMLANREADSLLSELELDIALARNLAITTPANISITPLVGNDWNTGWEIRDLTTNQLLKRAGSLNNPISEFNAISSSYNQLTLLEFDTAGRAVVAGNFQIDVPDCSGEHDHTLDIQFLGQIVITSNQCP